MSLLMKTLQEHRLEGIIVKRKNSTYAEGRKPGTWMKYRLYEADEFVIGGYLKRKDPVLDALIVGQYENRELLYKEKVRFGFEEQTKRSILQLTQALRISECPFQNLPEKPRRGAVDLAQMNEADGFARCCTAQLNTRRRPSEATSGGMAGLESC